MGRTASGVKGINLGTDANCICCEIVNETDTILLVTEKGYGKQTKVCDFRQTKRGSKGVKALNITDKNGVLVDILVSNNDQDLIIITNFGMTMRMPLNQINTLGHLKDNQKVSTISLVDKEVEEEQESESESESTIEKDTTSNNE